MTHLKRILIINTRVMKRMEGRRDAVKGVRLKYDECTRSVNLDERRAIEREFSM